MSTSRHRDVTPGATDSEASHYLFAVWRDIALASVVVAILFMGIESGAFSPQSSAELQIPAVQPYQELNPAVQPRPEFVYFPSQYVNQRIEIREHIPTFRAQPSATTVTSVHQHRAA